MFTFNPESLFTFNRYRCSRSTGISVQLQPEYALSSTHLINGDLFSLCENDNVRQIEGLNRACKLFVHCAHVHRRTTPSHAWHVGSPLFFLHLLHDARLKKLLAERDLEIEIFIANRFEFFDIRNLHPIVELFPAVDGLLDNT